MRHTLFLVLMLSFYCHSESLNPLIGHWKTDHERTLASTKKNTKAYQCFQQKLCGTTDLIFSENELISISYSQDGEEIMRYSEPYKITSFKGNEITIYYPKKDKNFSYQIKSNVFYYSSEEHGFTEYFLLKK
ncbi:hypothetical protein [Psychrosphaera aestuarii]|uniref:hypothetical protein n=1 Tax=Psychrosphaera aestuarii TaxID=1266052 RepID=UPI001B33C9A1|nr:hypothetical protein [Psychrosphaera aestuarii]